MSIRSITMLALIALSGAASARPQIDVQALADQAGLSTRQVRMVLGTHTAYAEYRTSYATSEFKLRKALGSKQFNELLVQAAKDEEFGRYATRP